MENKLEKYADIILKYCLNVSKNQPLVISCPIERIDFVRIIANKAYKIGVKDIYFDLYDAVLKKQQLINLDIKDIKNSSLWNKKIYNEYAKKGAAFLMLISAEPIMSDVDFNKLNKITTYNLEQTKIYNKYRDSLKIAWTIAAVATEDWSKQLFPNKKNSLNLLWNRIFKICHINDQNPSFSLIKERKNIQTKMHKLNSLKIKKLIFTNSLGTNLEIELSKNAVWCSGISILNNKKEVQCNYPSLEIFTSPVCNKTNGIVYSSKPLVYNGLIIEDFYLEFKNGKVINYNAKKGNDILKEILKSTKNINMLGEVALVPYNSEISKSGLLFYETLYDENASCHIALGSGYSECISNAKNKSDRELQLIGLNRCSNHIDFMIGTKDLNVKAITFDDKEIDIFIKGNFSKNI